MKRWMYELRRRTSLRVKILVATIMVVGGFTGLSLYQTVSFHTKSALSLVAQSSQSLLENTYSAIKYPMSVGDSKTVEAQLKDIKDHMEGVEVYISDLEQNLTYASEEDRIHTTLKNYLWEKETQKAVGQAIASGMPPRRSYAEFQDDEAFLVTMLPLLNEYTCHHCHGPNRKVLGIMVVKHPVTAVYAALSSARNRLILFSFIEIVGIILLITYLFNRLVTRRIHALAKNTDRIASGDIDIKIEDDFQDSIGRLTHNFNQMIRTIRDRIEYANSLKLGISEPFFMVDPDMKITYMNEAAAQLGGVRPEHVVDKKTCEEVFNSDVCHTACAIKRAMETGEATEGLKVTMKDTAGREIPIMVSAAALKDSRGKILGGFELIRDISREVEAQTVLHGLIDHTKRIALSVVGEVKDISEGNQKLSEHTQRADNLSKEAVEVAAEGGAIVEKTAQAMNDMSEGSRKIVEMMDLVNEITLKTTLLSINAGVEAARAGEHGRGFAVVANEVRNLAKKSSDASKHIETLVRDIMDKVNTGKQGVAELENGFKRIVGTIKQVSDALEEVTLSTRESSKGIGHIRQGVYELNAVISQNASFVEKLSYPAEQVNEKGGFLAEHGAGV